MISEIIAIIYMYTYTDRPHGYWPRTCCSQSSASILNSYAALLKLKHCHCVVIYQKQLAALYSNLLLVQCQALIELSPHPCVRSICDDFSALETTTLRLRLRVVNSSPCANM